MAVEIRVPSLGESVVEATIAQWLKKPGDTIAVGDSLAELETDKVNQSVDAEVAGVLGEITKNAGETVGIGEVIGLISNNGAVASGDASASTTSSAVTTTEKEAQAPAPPEEIRIQAADAPIVPSGTAVPVTPVAQRIAQDNNIDLSQVQGSGPNGRIVKNDVADAVERRQSEPATAVIKAEEKPTTAVKEVAPSLPVVAPKPTPPSNANGRPESREKMTRRRSVIAANLLNAKQATAMLTTFNECDLTAIMELRKRRKDAFKEKTGVNLGFMSFFTKATIGALRQFPYLNAEIQGDEILVKKYYDIGIAVGVPEGLVVPIVRDADKLTFAGIEKAIVDLAGKAREGKLSLAELQGGTFTITNGGVFGSLMSTPILNYPQVGILGMHTIKERPMVVNGEIVIRPMMYLALSYDHRIVDGGDAVRFLVRIKDLVEDPESLLLEG